MSNNVRIKHLELIQAVIGRMANNSFLIKGWTITISLAGFGLFANSNKTMFLFLVLFSTIIFWILDAYYLREERLFRKLYEETSIITNDQKNSSRILNMNVDKYNHRISNLLTVVISFPTFLIYISILFVTFVFYLKK